MVEWKDEHKVQKRCMQFGEIPGEYLSCVFLCVCEWVCVCVYTLEWIQ